jgi:hypothetical protein
MAIPASDMVCLLMGLPPDEPEGIETPEATREGEIYRIDQYRWNSRVRTLWITPEGRLRRLKSFTPEQTVRYTAEFSDYTPLAGGFLPGQVTLQTEEHLLSMRYGDAQPIDFEPEAFALPLPEGVSPILLDR